MGFHKRCCPSDFEPLEACSTSLEYIPPHPSAASRRVCRTTGPLSVTTLAEGCAIDVTIGDSTIGRHPLSLSVTSSQPLWTALAITWFDEPTNLDPHVIGSLSHFQTQVALKLRDAIGWNVDESSLPVDDRSGPWLIAGAAVEQAGQIYVAPTLNPGSLITPNPCCWRLIGGGGTDSDSEPCRLTRRRFVSETSSDTEAVIGGSGQVVQDFFGQLQPDGTIDRDIRPDFNVGLSPHPITRLGFVIGLTSCPWELAVERHGAEGTWSLAGVLGPLCGFVFAHGHPKTDGTTTDPEMPGTLIIDEPLNAVPTGWVTGDLSFDDEFYHPEGAGHGGIFTARDSALFIENVLTSVGEYPSGTFYKSLAVPRAAWQTGSQLTMEWTHRRVRDADRRWPLPGAPDPDEFRNQTSGVFVGGLFRLLMRHENAQHYDGGHEPGYYGWILSQCHRFGGSIRDNSQYTEWPGEWPYDGPDEPPMPLSLPCVLPGEPGYDARQNCDRVAIQDGDRVTLTLRCQRQVQTNLWTGTPTTDRIDVWAWQSAVWINGRTAVDIVFGGTPSSGGGFYAIPPLTTLRIGLLGLYGGGWSDLKAWIYHPS